MSSVATVEIRTSAVARLRPAMHAITDGSPAPVAVAVRLGKGLGKLALHVDPASARRFAFHRVSVQVTTVLVLAIGGTFAILYARASPIIVDDPVRWSLLALASAWLIAALHQSYLTPSVHPRLRGKTVRLSNVDDVAASQWQDANDPGVMSVKPDSPTRASLVRHAPPIVLAIAVAVLIAGLA